MPRMKVIIQMKSLFILCAVLVLCAGCRKDSVVEEQSPEPESTVQNDTVPEAVEEAVVIEEPRYDPEDGLICVLFGYGFNGEAFYSETSALLKEKYGIASENGIIMAINFPDDLKTRISNLYDIISENKMKGLILLGAPDNTHRTLTRLRDYWTQTNTPAPHIFSLMPQDDILGEESNCDFVLEYERTNSVEEESEESADPMDKTVQQIVIRAVRYMEELPEPLKASNELHAQVQAIVGAKKVRRYTDSETGLQSINHFVIEQ